MTNPTPSARDSAAQQASAPSAERRTANPSDAPTPMRCFTGALISGGLAVAMYFLTRSIIQVFAGIPLPTKSTTALNIAVAVRTLVMGTSTMAAAIFGIATLGLIALGIQLLIKQGRKGVEG